MAGMRSSNLWGGMGVFLIVLMGLVGIAVGGTYGGGTGTPEDPFQIHTAQDMQAIGADANDWDKCFILMADIDLAQFDGKDGRDEFNMIGNEDNLFAGVFDGNGHTISNFTYTSTGTNYFMGLFRCVHGPNVKIKDVGLINPNIDARTEDYYVGSLVGWLGDGTITNCYVEGGSVTGNDRVGGLVGMNGGTVTSCSATGTVTGDDAVGGLVGGNEGTVTSCSATGTVTGDVVVGGLVGDDWTGSITNSYATGNVSGTTAVGGLAGDSNGVNNCYATGSVSGTGQVGGLVGKNGGAVTKCHATGIVLGTGNYIGGLIGENVGKVSNSYATGNVSGIVVIGGLVGWNRYSMISQCRATGSVSGISRVGGLVGWDDEGRVSNCYARGSVSGEIFNSSEVGGLVGHTDWGIISNCYATGKVVGNWSIGGLVGGNEGGDIFTSFWDEQTSERGNMCGFQDLGGTGCNNANGMTTAQMYTQSTFTDAGWDFTGEITNGTDDIWIMFGDGLDYPRLTWALEPPSYSGSGSEGDPYLISTPEQMNEIGTWPFDWDKYFILTADIDLSGYTGTAFNIIGNTGTKFAGSFDGNGHTVRNFTYTATYTSSIGLFGYVGSGGEIKNLGLIDPNVDAGAGENIGSLVGQIHGGTITNCYVEGGSVSGTTNVGGSDIVIECFWKERTQCAITLRVEIVSYFRDLLVSFLLMTYTC